MKLCKKTIACFLKAKKQAEGFKLTEDNIEYYFVVICGKFNETEQKLKSLMTTEEVYRYENDHFFRSFIFKELINIVKRLA